MASQSEDELDEVIEDLIRTLVQEKQNENGKTSLALLANRFRLHRDNTIPIIPYYWGLPLFSHK